jgi:hypothetical protein
MDAPVDLCLDEQFALYQPPTWTDEKADAWYGCFAQNRTSPGVWGMQVVDERTGAGLTGGQTIYVWGWSRELGPADERIYLVEYLAGPGALGPQRPPARHPAGAHALADGLLAAPRRVPVPAAPSSTSVDPAARAASAPTRASASSPSTPATPPASSSSDGTIVAHDPDTDTWIVR